jgi:hypothetical protein
MEREEEAPLNGWVHVFVFSETDQMGAEVVEDHFGDLVRSYNSVPISTSLFLNIYCGVYVCVAILIL